MTTISTSTWDKMKAENASLKAEIERLLNEPRYYLSQSIMKGKLKPLQSIIKAKKLSQAEMLRWLFI